MNKILQSIVRTARGEISTKALVKRGLKVGKNFNRQGHCIIDPPHCWLITIGDNVTLATGVYILAHDASTEKIIGYTKVGNVYIGDNVFIGAYATILPNVRIGKNSIVGCGSVVSKNVPDNVVVAGNPAKIICTIDEFKKKQQRKFKNSPIFNEQYTLRGGITKNKKEEMRKALNDGIGFVI